MCVPKEHSRKLLRSVGGEGTGVIEATSVARMRALLKSRLATIKLDNRVGGISIWREKGLISAKPEEDTALESHRDSRDDVLASVSDFLVFRLTCVGPGSASVCAGGARGNLQDEFSQESLFGSGSA